MSRGSFGRAVARAAASGGSKNYRARPPVLWYVLMVIIVLGGLGLIGYSRNENLTRASVSAEPPTKTDNWHAALAVDICGTLRPNLPPNANLATAGIRTFGDGVIDVDPGAVSNSSSFTGKHDTLSTFVSTYGQGFALTDSSITLPAKATSTSATTPTTAPATSTTAPKKAATSTTAPKKAATSTTAPKKAATSTGGTKAGTTTSAHNKTTTKATAATKTTTPTRSAKATGASTSAASAGATTSSSAAGTHSSAATPPSSTSPAVKSGPTYRNGQACPTTSKTPGTGRLVAKVWSSPSATPQLVTTGIPAIRITNGEMITLAFVPKGASIPAPSSRAALLQAMGSSASSTGTTKK